MTMSMAGSSTTRQNDEFIKIIPNQLWFRPSFFILLPVSVSYATWAILAWRALDHTRSSWEKLSGFASPSPVTARGSMLLIVWYAAVVSVATIGWRLGVDPKPRAEVAAEDGPGPFERRYFQLTFAVSVVGIAYSYYKIGSAQSILDSFVTQENQFTLAIPGSAGVQTLRSATILAAPVGVYLWQRKIIGLPYMVSAVLLLLLNAMIASRLSILMAAMVYLVIWLRAGSGFGRTQLSHSKRWLTLVTVSLLVFAVMTGLNYLRNANYYRDAGVSNPVAMNVYQIGAYLASPSQTSLGVADAIMRGTWEQPGDPIGSINAIRPTFLQFTKVAKGQGSREPIAYGYSVDLQSNFTTNSVFADTYADFGMWGWIYTILLYAFAGYLFARLLRNRIVIAGSAGIMAYCIAEMWRIQLVTLGFVIFLLLLTWSCALVAGFWSRRETSAGIESVGSTAADARFYR